MESTSEGGSGTSSSGTTDAGSETGPEIDCGEITHNGNLIISDGTDPDETNTITHVTGNVVVKDTTGLEDLSLLADLVCVDEELNVEFNQALASLDGLENLRRVGARLVLGGNPLLARADALAGLVEAGGFRITGNASFDEFPVFSDGFWLRGPAEVTIRSNAFDDLSGLLQIPDLVVTGNLDISIDADDHLQSTYGIGALAQTGGTIDLSISGSEGTPNVLEEIDLAGFEEVNNLYIGSALSGVQTLYAPNLTRVTRLHLLGLDGLTDLTGLSALEEVAQWIKIGCGLFLPGGGFDSLSGLEALEIAPVLVIGGNPSLTSIDALSTSLGTEELVLMNNALLPGADADAYAAAVGSAETRVCGNLDQPPCAAKYDCFAVD